MTTGGNGGQRRIERGTPPVCERDTVAGVAELSRQHGGVASRKAGPEAAQAVLGAERQRLQHLLAVSPAIIYSTKASGDFACTFVSETIRTIMGFAPEDMLTDPKCWPDRLHPEDGPRVFEELPPLIERGGGTLVYRFRHADGSYIWIQDTFKVVNDEQGQPMELVGAWPTFPNAGAPSSRCLRPTPNCTRPSARSAG